MTLEASGIRSQEFDLYGTKGEFVVLPSPKWKVVHFSTMASNSNESHGGNCLSLLRELKPMRERVEADKISAMSSLLQRDLSDFRVANDLVPYLMRNDVGVGFFPGILVALMPKGYLNDGGNGVLYPRAVINKDKTRISYGEGWNLELFKSDGKLTSLGKISINPEKTDIVVLDGQHRANAFRFVTNTFEAAIGPSIYSPFYGGLEAPDETFTSELPVTLVWFEKLEEKEVTPLLISRRLFVDVNTNAQKVNECRNILLDDEDNASIATSNFYSYLAGRKFSTDEVSLLHSGFDSDGHHYSKLSLFTPSEIHYVFSWFCFAKFAYDDISKLSISRDTYRMQKNIERLDRLFIVLDEGKRPNLTGSVSLFEKHEALRNSNTKYAIALFDQFNFIQKHLDACGELRQWIITQSSTIQEIWRDVYVGGEGLFSSYHTMSENSPRLTDSAKTYYDGINEIESKFIKIRSLKYSSVSSDLVNKAYNTFSTKATLTGLFMAFWMYAETTGFEYKDGNGQIQLAAENYIRLLNNITPEQWVYVFTKLKEGAVGSELNPKLWPHMRNLFLRIVQEQGEEEYFNVDN